MKASVALHTYPLYFIPLADIDYGANCTRHMAAVVAPCQNTTANQFATTNWHHASCAYTTQRGVLGSARFDSCRDRGSHFHAYSALQFSDVHCSCHSRALHQSGREGSLVGHRSSNLAQALMCCGCAQYQYFRTTPVQLPWW